VPIPNDDRDEILTRLGRRESVLKIVLKTKNDPIFLEAWIKHHLGIVGSGNSIIFDNKSSDRDVLEVYERYAVEVEVVSFGDFHNDIHYQEKFPDLYGALSKTCTFFTVLDTVRRRVACPYSSVAGTEGKRICAKSWRLMNTIPHNRSFPNVIAAKEIALEMTESR
jgi:hypothetical protein